MTTISTDELKEIRDYAEAECGLTLREEQADFIQTGLERLMREYGCEDLAALHRLIESGNKPELRDRIIDAMTSRETLWFRDTHPFMILKEKILPGLAEGIVAGQRPGARIWSAGCSTGQEPYSVALTVLEFCEGRAGVNPEHFEILATDISPAALLLGMAGRFDRMAMSRGLPTELRDRYFKEGRHAWELDPSIKKMVSFRQFRLQDSPIPLGKFDVVFMRYVTGGLSEDLNREIFANLTQVLSPAGYLLLGADESIGSLSDAYETLTHAGGQYFRCR